MNKGDLAAVIATEKATYPQPWSEAVFRDELAQENRIYLVVEVEGEVVGYGGLMEVAGEAHITNVAIDAGHRGAQLGTKLMLALTEAAIDHGASHLTLEVRSSNARAQALYRRFGMMPVGVRKDYYIDEDALIMWVHDIDGPVYKERLESIKESLR